MSTATFPQATHILTLANQKSLSKEAIDLLIQTGLLADLFESAQVGKIGDIDREVFRKLLDLDPFKLSISIDYNLSLIKMIEAGQYNWCNDNINSKNFPIVGQGVMRYETKLFDFGCVSSEDADRRIQESDIDHPWVSAKIERVLAFGATYPEMQRKFWIVGLGSSCVIDGYRKVPVLYSDDSSRHLILNDWDGDWNGRGRFLAERTLSSGS